MTQAELFEPTGAQVSELALGHMRRADAADRHANAAKAYGWLSVERRYRADAQDARTEAECLAMLADFERLGGVAT